MFIILVDEFVFVCEILLEMGLCELIIFVMIVLQERRFLILNCFIVEELFEFQLLDRVEILVDVMFEKKEVGVVDNKKFEKKGMFWFVYSIWMLVKDWLLQYE